LNVLLAAARRADAGAHMLRLSGCSHVVLRLITATRVDDSFAGIAARGPSQPFPTTAHTDLPVGSSRTPHATDRPATTCRPRPRGAVTSKGRGPAIGPG
jgi:hypothetical protein